MNTNYKKGIHVQFFLLHEQKKWVISNFTQSGLKKKKERKKEPRLSRCPESFTFGFFCSLVPWEATSGRSRPLEVSAASLHPPRQKLRSGAPSFLCSDPGRRRWAQQDGEEGRETWRIRFPPPHNQARDALGSLTFSGERLEVTAPKNSSPGAMSSSQGDED